MIKAAIATYREELTRAGAVDDATIEELVDHLEASIEANVAAGASEFEAIRDARAGLGEPAIIARECATVRSAFGPKPATWRAWSAAALCLLWCGAVVSSGWFHDGAGYGITILGSVMALALAVRMPQATAFATGYAGAALVFTVIRWCLFPPWNLHFSVDGALREHYLVAIGTTVFEAAAFALLAWRSRPNRWTLAMSALGVVAFVQLAARLGHLPTAHLPAPYRPEFFYDLLLTALPLIIATTCLAIAVRSRVSVWLASLLAVIATAGAVNTAYAYVTDHPVADLRWMIMRCLGCAGAVAAVVLLRRARFATRRARDATLQLLRG